MTNSPKPRRKFSREQLIPLIAGVSALVIVLAFVVWNVAAPKAAVPETKPTGSPTTEPVVIPDMVHVAAEFGGWKISAADANVRFSAEAGSVSDGGVALRIDNSLSQEVTPLPSLGQSIAVEPLTKYDFSAQLQVVNRKAKAFSVVVGDEGTRHDFDVTDDSWTEVEWSYTTADAQTALPLSVLAGPGVSVIADGLTMTTKDIESSPLVNGSFEDYSAPTQVANSSLVMSAGEANIGLAWRVPSVTWSVTDELGTEVSSGAVDLPQGLGVVPLDTLAQGFYSIKLAADGAEPIDTTFLVLDKPKDSAAVTDARFGTHAYANSGTLAAELGMGSLRTDVLWAEAELTKNEYVFKPILDPMFTSLQAAGVEVMPVSDYNNTLYDIGRTVSSDEGIAAYGKYSGEIAKHFGSSSIEIYNEFNHPPFNNGVCGVEAECYLPLLKASYEAVKAENPAITVVGPATARHDDEWITDLYKLGGIQYLDAISFHPYDYDSTGAPEFLMATLQQAGDRIREYNNGVSKPIWLTELGWSTASFSEEQQAQFLVRAQTIALANGVEKFFWYDLVNDFNDPAEHEGNFGLVKLGTETVPALAPKLSAMSQAVLIRAVGGKDWVSRDELNESTYSYVFGSGADETRVAWATAPATVAYASDEPITVTSQYGHASEVSPVDGVITISLGEQPQYLSGAVTAPTIVG
ncbi:glycosyl hydrolase [Cryobacterium sp. TMS1-20-1]|uniref:glycosyl hydrolase n=1 Tax=Cryobacterium sp. TMS1-20-1 TaxID=1259223 RepID=UPI00141B6986|nr:glycosyl hydrolase [Cryobacterium sp. TMS1-20-1]